MSGNKKVSGQQGFPKWTTALENAWKHQLTGGNSNPGLGEDVLKHEPWNFPGGPRLKNLPCNARRNLEFDSGQGSKITHGVGVLSLRTRDSWAHVPELESSCAGTKTDAVIKEINRFFF